MNCPYPKFRRSVIALPGIGIAILPSNVENIQRRGVIYRKIQHPNLHRQISGIWRKDDSSVFLQEFLKIVRELSDFPTNHLFLLVLL
jgi:DNA-binding transcriptional LysR family regulator